MTICMTEAPSTLRRWVVAGPEVSHLLAQYGSECETKAGTQQINHHVDRTSTKSIPWESGKAIKRHGRYEKSLSGRESGPTFTRYNIFCSPHCTKWKSTNPEKCTIRYQEFLTGLKNRTDLFRQEPASVNSPK